MCRAVVSGLSRSYSAANVEPISAVNQNCSVAVEEVSSINLTVGQAVRALLAYADTLRTSEP